MTSPFREWSLTLATSAWGDQCKQGKGDQAGAHGGHPHKLSGRHLVARQKLGILGRVLMDIGRIKNATTTFGLQQYRIFLRCGNIQTASAVFQTSPRKRVKSGSIERGGCFTPPLTENVGRARSDIDDPVRMGEHRLGHEAILHRALEVVFAVSRPL